MLGQIIIFDDQGGDKPPPEETSTSETTKNASNDELPPVKYGLQKYQRAFLFMLFTYTIQGMVLDYFLETIPTLLMSTDSSYSNVALLSICAYPWCTKLLWAPFQDTFYFKFLGKRKTFIIASQLLATCLLFALSFQVDQYIQEGNALYLLFYGLALSILLTMQDVSADGWCVKMVPEEKTGLMSFASNFGYTLGDIISFDLFIWLNDDSVCRDVLGLSGKLLTHRSLCLFMSFYTLVITLTTLFAKKEEKDRVQSSEKLSDVYYRITQIMHDSRLLMLALLLLFQQIGICIMTQLGPYDLIQNGLSPSVYNIMWLVGIFFEGVTGYYCSQLCAKKLETKLWIASLIGYAIAGIAQYWICICYNNGTISVNTMTILFFGEQLLENVVYAMMVVSQLAFVMRICDKQIEGSFIAIFTSISYFGGTYPATIALYLGDYFTLTQVFYFSFSFNVIFIVITFKVLLKLQDYESESLEDIKLKKGTSELEKNLIA